MRIRSLAILSLIAVAAACFADGYRDPAVRAADKAAKDYLKQNPGIQYMPGRVLVRFSHTATEKGKKDAIASVNGMRMHRYTLVEGLELISTDRSDAAIEALAKNKHVLYAHRDSVVYADLTPNDPSFGSLWGMHQANDFDIDAPEAWDTTTGDPNFLIADIDTGVNYNHADLAANRWTNVNEIPGNAADDDGNGFVDDIRGYDFYNNDGDPNDDHDHGTHTVGTFGAVGNNGVGVAGVNWNCKFVALKFLGAGGSGSTADAIRAVQYCTTMGIKVSNNSWGGGGYDQALYDAIQASQSIGHIFVAAAGNSGLNNDVSPHYPSSYNLDNVIAVASITSTGARSSFSNYGATSVDLAAPGSSIYSTTRAGYAFFSGTSMATPHVTGVVGLVYAQNPTWTYSQVVNRVLTTAVPISSMAGLCVTGGLLNAAAAVAGGPPANTVPTTNITSPPNGASYVVGTTVTFTGTANDNEDGNLTASMTWSSNIQGALGAGGSFTRSDLIVGTHVITASVTDSGSLSGSSSRTITITSGVTPPAAPGTPVASRQSAGVALVTWADNSSNETSFTIERQTRNGNVWGSSALFSVGANVTSFTNNAGVGRFRYRVRSNNSAGSSSYTAWSNQVKL